MYDDDDSDFPTIWQFQSSPVMFQYITMKATYLTCLYVIHRQKESERCHVKPLGIVVDLEMHKRSQLIARCHSSHFISQNHQSSLLSW